MFEKSLFSWSYKPESPKFLAKKKKTKIKGNYMKHKANLDKKYLHAVLCCKISVNNLFLSDIIHSFADLNSKLNKLAWGYCLGKKINSKFLFKDLTHSTFFIFVIFIGLMIRGTPISGQQSQPFLTVDCLHTPYWCCSCVLTCTLADVALEIFKKCPRSPFRVRGVTM